MKSACVKKSDNSTNPYLQLANNGNNQLEAVRQQLRSRSIKIISFRDTLLHQLGSRFLADLFVGHDTARHDRHRGDTARLAGLKLGGELCATKKAAVMHTR